MSTFRQRSLRTEYDADRVREEVDGIGVLHGVIGSSASRFLHPLLLQMEPGATTIWSGPGWCSRSWRSEIRVGVGTETRGGAEPPGRPPWPHARAGGKAAFTSGVAVPELQLTGCNRSAGSSCRLLKKVPFFDYLSSTGVVVHEARIGDS